ncbi:helix-hairpin-helix domain-containing protein [Flavilitoribacter nigricans]|uniref:DNA-binding protein n=1 Tax=Flavilitoribacter nigricans (strain ATCC 23147 / DSM 23189 / NBRC 102662 / NCIMB 1420 / SS-2) TaxID=1122177 RepID=A0A2D0N727_FLAN2|nr:helix-hairpin-helix domain-containing protein [Flavilitoribacter nigricans]PHN03573.1 DNA-binding protein [Flavilitoribacter nigricans DSM 23189 = NBRC 102662]
MIKKLPNNHEIAQLLEHIASLLELQDANTFRVQAYRSGANQVREAQVEIAELALSDKQTLLDMPHIGERLTNLIIEYAKTGKSRILQRLEGEVHPDELFESVPGIGPELADRIVEELDIKTLEELEQAVYDGRLAKVEGFGEKRLETVRLSLAGKMRQPFRRMDPTTSMPGHRTGPDRPSVELLLRIDEEYRTKAKNKQLKRIAPRRFNPENRAWLPILHTDLEGWSFTALFSNTVRAHELQKVKDWVVIYYEKDQHEGQATVVTETRGKMEGKRVVRGREQESMEMETIS